MRNTFHDLTPNGGTRFSGLMYGTLGCFFPILLCFLNTYLDLRIDSVTPQKVLTHNL